MHILGRIPPFINSSLIFRALMDGMRMKEVSRKVVKPCKATPAELRRYKISIIDELNPSMHVIRILFFESAKEDLWFLEESLGRVLPQFYPLAGRYNKEQHYVDCSDQGADYSVALVEELPLAQLMASNLEAGHLNRLLPLDICAADDPTDPMLAIRINRFECGGLAIGVCASHRILDSASVGIFLTAWANAAVGGGSTIRPDFDSPSYFPSKNLPPLQFQVSRARNKTIVSKMFRFDKDAISRLRETLSEEWKSAGLERPPSRVVAVSALLTGALLRIRASANNALIAQAINVRERTAPPVSKHSIGTWVSLSYLEFDREESETLAGAGGLPRLALKMREAAVQGVDDCARILSDRDFGRRVLVDTYFEAARKAESDDYKVVWVTDWSKFGDYELDFGFGKPVWVSLADVPLKDLFILMNTRDNQGIEAWVYLHESDMPSFQQDQDLTLLTNLVVA